MTRGGDVERSRVGNWRSLASRRGSGGGRPSGGGHASSARWGCQLRLDARSMLTGKVSDSSSARVVQSGSSEECASMSGKNQGRRLFDDSQPFDFVVRDVSIRRGKREDRFCLSIHSQWMAISQEHNNLTRITEVGRSGVGSSSSSLPTSLREQADVRM